MCALKRSSLRVAVHDYLSSRMIVVCCWLVFSVCFLFLCGSGVYILGRSSLHVVLHNYFSGVGCGSGVRARAEFATCGIA